MRGQFRRNYPENGTILLDGGLNTKFEKSIIEDNESPDCANVVFTNGAVETRQGAVKLNTTSVGSFSIDGIYSRRARDNSETMLVFAGSKMWQLATTTFTTIPSAVSVFTAGFRVCAAMAENYMFFGNGSQIPYKWNGTEFTRHGVYPPTSGYLGAGATASVASNGVGNLTGGADYRYKITFVNSNLVESDVGPVTATFTISATSGQNTISSIPVAPQSWGVNSRRIYRTAGNGTTFKRLVTISDNTTTTYNDNIADGSLGATAPTDNGVPPNYSAVIYHQGRLFMLDPSNRNYVWYTELNNPYTVASTNFFYVGDNTSDLAQGFGVFDNSLYVFCEKSAMIVYMADTTPSNWNFIRAKSNYGTKSPFGIVAYQDKQLFPAMEGTKFVGFGALRGQTMDTSTTFLTVASVGSELKSERIETDMFSVSESLLSGISSIVYKNKIYASVPYGSATENNRIYVMDFSSSNLKKDQKESWVPWTGLSASQFCIYGGNLYYGSSTATGFIYKLETGVYSDDGSAINSYYWTKEYPGHPSDVNYTKDFRFAKILVDQAGDYYMDVAYRVNSDKGSGTNRQIYLNPGSSLWGSMVWGRDSWGGGTYQDEKVVYLDTARGLRIQFKFSNRNIAGQRFKVHHLNFSYNLKGYR